MLNTLKIGFLGFKDIGFSQIHQRDCHETNKKGEMCHHIPPLLTIIIHFYSLMIVCL